MLYQQEIEYKMGKKIRKINSFEDSVHIVLRCMETLSVRFRDSIILFLSVRFIAELMNE